MSKYEHLLTACIEVILEYIAAASSAPSSPLDYQTMPGDTLCTLLTERIESLDTATTDKKPFLLYMTYIIARCWNSKNAVWPQATYHEIHQLFTALITQITTLSKKSNRETLEIIYAGTTISVSGFLNGWILGSSSKTRLGAIVQRRLEQNTALFSPDELQIEAESVSKVIQNILQIHQYPFLQASLEACQAELAQLLSQKQTVTHFQSITTQELARLTDENKKLSSDNQRLVARLAAVDPEKELSWTDLKSAFFKRVQNDLSVQPHAESATEYKATTEPDRLTPTTDFF